jgi:hypothetical protein
MKQLKSSRKKHARHHVVDEASCSATRRDENEEIA